MKPPRRGSTTCWRISCRTRRWSRSATGRRSNRSTAATWSWFPTVTISACRNARWLPRRQDERLDAGFAGGASLPERRPRLFEPAAEANRGEAAGEAGRIVGVEGERAQRRRAHRRLELAAGDAAQEPRQ